MKQHYHYEQENKIRKATRDEVEDYLKNPDMITINLNDGYKKEDYVNQMVRYVFQRYYQSKYKKNWIRKKRRQRFVYAIERANGNTHIHLLIDNLNKKDYKNIAELFQIAEIEIKRGIKIKQEKFNFICQQTNSMNYLIDKMSSKERDIHCYDLLGLTRTYYINEEKSQNLLKKTKIKTYNNAMRFLEIISTKSKKQNLVKLRLDILCLENELSKFKQNSDNKTLSTIRNTIEKELQKLKQDYEIELKFSKSCKAIKEELDKTTKLPPITYITDYLCLNNLLNNDVDIRDWKIKSHSQYLAEQGFKAKRCVVNYFSKQCSANNYNIYSDKHIFY